MRNPRLAEWILSLVTAPERASATVGDLLEDRVHAGALRFWSAVLITAGSLLWRDVIADPKRIAGLAVYGVFLELLLSFVAAVVLVVLYAVIALVGSGVNPGVQWTVGPSMPLSVITAGTIAGWALGLGPGLERCDEDHRLEHQYVQLVRSAPGGAVARIRSAMRGMNIWW